MQQGKVILLKNERDEWELPGGRIEPGESPEECLAREIQEELRLHVAVETILDCWVYEISPAHAVFISTYACREAKGRSTPEISAEHKELKLFSLDELAGLRIPAGYVKSIRRASSLGFS